MIVSRMMWKDWGFAATLCDQAKHFLDLAKRTATADSEREGFVRASIVFSVMSFEAFFFNEIIRGYVQRHAATLDAAKVRTIEKGLTGGPPFKGIAAALNDWPCLLTGNALAPSSSTEYFTKLLEYRNALTHGDIIRHLPMWGTLAQEVENIANAELALQATAEMKLSVAAHFGL